MVTLAAAAAFIAVVVLLAGIPLGTWAQRPSSGAGRVLVHLLRRKASR